MITHKHLRGVIEDIYLNGNMLTPELFSRLANEFRYSSLYIPAKREDNRLNFIIYEDGDSKITPLFTDLDEFRKFYKDDDIEVLNNPFETYRNIIRTTEIEGYILNPSSEKYLFDKEFILSIENIPKSSFFLNNPYSEDELSAIARSIDNQTLESFIADRANIGDFEGLFERLSNSRLIALMISERDLSFMAKDGMISQKSTGPLASMYMDRVGGRYAAIFSSLECLKAVPAEGFKYFQLVNLATLVNFVLTEDMEGIILNPSTDNVLIPRVTLLRYSLGFERYANDERLYESIYYLFSAD